MDRITLDANGLTFESLSHGTGDRRALLLHGFPDDPRSMRGLMRRLADAGVETVAPWMRGYGPTERPSDGNYRLDALGADAIGLLDALGWDRAMLMGHDWGALAGYVAANLAPHRLSHLVAMCVPPPRIFARNLIRHPLQFKRSWYILFFQLPFVPEQWLERRDFETLESLWTDLLRTIDGFDDHMHHVRETFREPGTTRAALSYYRHIFPSSIRDWPSYRRSLSLAWQSIECPTLMITGERDPAVGVEMFEDLEPAFEAPHDLITLFGGGHFIQLEAPDAIARAAIDFCGISHEGTSRSP